MEIHKKPTAAQRPHPAYIYEIAEFDENAKYLISWPGYRTSMNKSGLGYVETQAELARMRGLFIRWLVTGKFKTRNPVFLALIAIYGILSASPILLVFAGIDGQTAFFRNWIFFGPHTLIGILLLLNVILSLIKCDKDESITGD
jgi:hypothetical protein